MTIQEIIAQDKQEYVNKIAYYAEESRTPTIVDENRTFSKKEKRQFRKWLKQRRKAYTKYFKEWAPYDTCFLYVPLKMILQDMFEYYKNGINVYGCPVVEENGESVLCDTRRQTLAKALCMMEIAEYTEDYGNYKESQELYVKAFGYIAEHMREWWD